MRGIEFRGIPFDWDQFISGSYVEYKDRHYIYTEMYEKATHLGILSQVQVDPSTVGQYIGLNDTQGEPVFQGDIIIFDNTNIGGGVTKGEVIWNEDLTLVGLGWHLWVIETNINNCHAGFMGMDWLGKITIESNIHENPGLLAE